MPGSQGSRPFPPAAGVRIGWAELPESVRAGIEGLLGARVVSAISQPSGFSPGAALRLELADQRRAFVKAVGSEPNAETPKMHREEARTLSQLPRSAPVPRLLGVHDDGNWVAVVLEDVAGRHPRLPWLTAELGRVLAALEDLQSRLTPCPILDLPTVVERHLETFDGWQRLARAPTADLDPWAQRHLGQLAEREAHWAESISGDTLLHADLRADNLLLTDSGSVMFLDWPAACRGVDWFDPLVMAPSVAMQGGPDPEWVVQHHGSARRADPETITTLVVALAGYFAYRSSLPAPPGLPTLRPFQAAQARAALEWATARTGWS
ncbi:MAG TPA: phosphotransferase [Candidatus Dormibacteraeota bacterium]|nr:phosphotransferase [Candidatus Dormibacteraeota bacterium]